MSLSYKQKIDFSTILKISRWNDLVHHGKYVLLEKYNFMCKLLLGYLYNDTIFILVYLQDQYHTWTVSPWVTHIWRDAKKLSNIYQNLYMSSPKSAMFVGIIKCYFAAMDNLWRIFAIFPEGWVLPKNILLPELKIG